MNLVPIYTEFANFELIIFWIRSIKNVDYHIQPKVGFSEIVIVEPVKNPKLFRFIRQLQSKCFNMSS